MAKSDSPIACSTPDNSIKGEKKKKSIIPKIFSSKRRNGTGDSSIDDDIESDGDKVSFGLQKNINARRKAFVDDSPWMKKSFSERQSSPGIEGLDLSTLERFMSPATEMEELRMFVATWNVGGKTPNIGLNLEDFLQVEESADIYVCGFQEIVPLSAGNVLVGEDNEPAAKWLVLINQTLNKPQTDAINDLHDGESYNGSRTSNSKDFSKSNHLFQKHSLKVLSKACKADNGVLKMCNCAAQEKTRVRKYSDPITSFDYLRGNDNDGSEYFSPDGTTSPTTTSQLSYNLVASKQMVGLFLSVWAKKELVPHIGHLRITTVGRGIMGCLGNKGCISISMSVHRTNFCFVCSHLASGEKEGDELKRNADVAEIMKSVQFPNVCKNSISPAPDRILQHERVIWLGDLNYRMGLSYEETLVLLEDNDWDTLLEKDQLNMEREAGRVFSGFNEGRIMFAPTYKYSHNSDSYAGETIKSKKKRRTPSWCDRILWRGNGIDQLSYVRGESRFSDHRPVCAVFSVQVEMRTNRTGKNGKLSKGVSCIPKRFEFDECMPQRHSFSVSSGKY